MPNPRQLIIKRSRDRNFLLRAALVIGAVGVGLGLVVAQFGPAKGKLAGVWSTVFGGVPEIEEYVREHIGEPSAEDGATSLLEQVFGDKPLPPEVVAGLVRAGQFVDGQLASVESDLRPLFQDYADALYGSATQYERAKASLLAAAAEQPPPRFANSFAGHLLQREREHRAAADHFATEVQHHPRTTFARRAEMISLLELDDKETLRARTDDPVVKAVVSYDVFVDALVATGQWGRLSVDYLRGFIAGFEPAWAGIALFAALVWFVIIGQLSGLESGSGGRMAIYLIAFLLGCASVLLVIPVITFQDRVVGLAPNGEFINDAVFFISGVALREELVKLLAFVPLLPFLLKRRSSMEALAAAACVGLGFAFIENFQHTGAGREAGLFGRLATANFLHAGWTGLAGLALFHLCRWPKTRWEEFLATLIGVILAHGFYDLFQTAGAWSEFAAGLPVVIVLALTAYRYIDTAGEVREGQRAELSPLGVFVIGAALVLASSWVHACWHTPLADVMERVGGSALKLGALLFVFINKLRAE